MERGVLQMKTALGFSLSEGEENNAAAEVSSHWSSGDADWRGSQICTNSA